MKILERIISFEIRPSMYMDRPSFSNLKNLLVGYFLAMEDATGIPYNYNISEWLNKNRKHKSSLFWTEYVLVLRAKGDEEKAYHLLLDIVKKFLKESQEDNLSNAT